MKKKVAIIYPYFAHYREPIIRRLLEDKEVDYYFMSGDKTNSVYSSVKLHNFNGERRFHLLKNVWLFKYFLFQFSIIPFLKKENIDTLILLSDWKYISYWYLLLYSKFTNRKCFFWSHGLLNKRMSLNNRIKFFFHTLFDGGLVYSERSKNIMKELGFKKEIKVVNNSLDYEKQNEVFENLNLDNLAKPKSITKPYIIFTARLIKERNLELLFKAMAYLNEIAEPVNLLILGSGPYEETLKAAVRKYKIENQVIFGGACYDENLLGSYFINSEMCVFPGPIGLTIIHSMTYGIPVITNDNLDVQKPEIEALIDGVNGFFFRENDYKDLADKILRVRNMEPEMKLKLGLCARKRIRQNYTPDFQAGVIKDLIS